MLANNELATLPPGLFATGGTVLFGINVTVAGNPLESSEEPVPSTFTDEDGTVVRPMRFTHDRMPVASANRPLHWSLLWVIGVGRARATRCARHRATTPRTNAATHRAARVPAAPPIALAA